MLCLLLNRPIKRQWRRLSVQRLGRPAYVTVFSTLRTTSTHSWPASRISRVRPINVNLCDRLTAAEQLQLSAASQVWQLSETRDAVLQWFRTSVSGQQTKRDGSSGRRGSQSGSEQDPDKPPDEGPVTQMLKTALWMAVVYWSVSQLSSVLYGNSQADQILRLVSWHEFVHQMLARGEVQELIVHPDSGQVTVVLHEGAVLRGRRVDYNVFHLNVPDTNQFEQRLREAEAKIGVSTEDGVPVIYYRSTDTTSRLITVLLLTGLFGYLLSRGRMKLSSSMGGLGRLSRAKFTIVDSLAGEGRGVKFSDVAGLEEAKQEVVEFVDYLKRPEYYRNLGAKVPKGALLLGPPGCGKTLLAKAVATEGGVPFLTMNGSEFIEMIGGLGAARVRDLFKEARKRSPCIVFIDEIDAIGRARGAGSNLASGGSGEMEQTLNQLLVEMDGMSTTSGVIMLASTNRADLLDKALLRPGRFDRHISIDLPTLLERQQIFNHHLGSIVLEQEPQHYSLRLAKLTPGFSGADIMNVCNESALKAARDGGKKVTAADLDYAVERVVGGTEKRSHVLSPAERRVVAVHESGHALVGWLLQHTDALLKVSIVPRTQGVLGFARYTPSDQKLYSTEQLFDRMCMALGGRVAESMVFNTITDGARDDLQRVTKMAYAQIRQFGMSEELGVISFDDNASGGGRRPYSKHTANIIDVTARRLVARAYHTTDRLLRDNKHKLALMSDALMSRDALTYQDVVELIGDPPYGNKRRVTSEEFEGALSAHPGVDGSPQSPSSVESPQESTDSPSSPSQRDEDDISDPSKS